MRFQRLGYLASQSQPTADSGSNMADIRPGNIKELGIIIMIIALTKGVSECCYWVGNELLSTFGFETGSYI
jgi:hypothetical protein